MKSLAKSLSRLWVMNDDPVARVLLRVLSGQTSVSSSGFPYLNPREFAYFRDSIPHILDAGRQCWESLDRVVIEAEELELTRAERESLERAVKVVQTMLRTACITAPPDLWLLRHVMGHLVELNITERLLDGELLDPGSLIADVDGDVYPLDPAELEADLDLLVARGYLTFGGGLYGAAEHPRARRALSELTARPPDHGYDTTSLWTAVFKGEDVNPTAREALMGLRDIQRPNSPVPGYTWVASLEELELGYRLLPIVLALHTTGHTTPLARGRQPTFDGVDPELLNVAQALLIACGTLEPASWFPTVIGRRVFERGPGPFGIIGAYAPYMLALRKLALEGSAEVWVERGANVAASQDANRRSFMRANDALDRFCKETGFRYRVFIEHAVGRGEASRQRYERSGDRLEHYVGADLEEAAIEAARQEQALGRLPRGMWFVGGADIGAPETLLNALRARGVETQDAVMIVGNGFHEVRAQTDEKMVTVFKGYHDAGVVILFAEESALGTEDLLKTAWNTYHAGFRYVHTKSGQGLRPAVEGPPARFGRALPASWLACAEAAGYVRMDGYCHRSRTIYPYSIPDRHNPSISVNHFFIPAELATRLKGNVTSPPSS